MKPSQNQPILILCSNRLIINIWQRDWQFFIYAKIVIWSIWTATSHFDHVTVRPRRIVMMPRRIWYTQWLCDTTDFELCVCRRQTNGRQIFGAKTARQQTSLWKPTILATCSSVCDTNASTTNNMTRLRWTIQALFMTPFTFKNLPTPIMSGVRTPSRQFSSCVLIECDDSLDSINATTSAIVRYVSQRAGIGVNAGRIRAH